MMVRICSQGVQCTLHVADHPNYAQVIEKQPDLSVFRYQSFSNLFHRNDVHLQCL